MQKFDAIVLGAGIVGVSTAVHLQKRGVRTALVDRTHPGEETSYGNAGIIERNGFVPHGFPRSPSVLAAIIFKQSIAANYDLGTVFKRAPWLWQLYKQGGKEQVQAYAHAAGALRKVALDEHRALARPSNADRFYRSTGWLSLYRSLRSFNADEAERHYARIFGVEYQELSAGEINSVEPGIRAGKMLGVHWPETESVSNPGAVTNAFWRYFIQIGGQFFYGDGERLEAKRSHWRLTATRDVIDAKELVVALGPWSGTWLAQMDEHYPMAVKRGYHQHFRPVSGGSLSRPVVDMDNGYALTPMDQGIRLTTGVEFAQRDAPPTPVQLIQAKRAASSFLTLGRALDEDPWMGCRPCMPDGLPVIGLSPRTEGLWFNFGHGHAGFTLGPATGRLLAELMTGQPCCVDPVPYSPLRFI
ncbi:D-amino-acid dehydrogenase [Roseibium hamelinense]|uniref:D-amino-acid dehydrogenase n=1 Tax=Roseibium hamelinense TaxID=150831 RepID=A0A562TAN9_9HYPH|nr:FAD-binding oxidoreductase [Roseibium hamelinense]MTI45156.1 FAD-binding oxidoreductase [Roseibium hamelinense]TWI90483.1 D-amino-acid dehydrogenase [Roseibium hamelinense]